MRTRSVFLFSLAFIFFAAAGGYWYTTSTATAEPTSSLTSYLSGENSAGFAQATEPFAISFPEDLGPHEAYETEWWYYTGIVETAEERPFGFQFTIFRRALSPEMVSADNAWSTNQIYFAHFTISDIANGAFYDNEKFSRGSADLAGAQAVPYHVWIEDWEVREQADGSHRITAQADEVALDLTLTQTRPPVLHGEGGLSRKGVSEGNASYYYSLIDQASVGTVTINEETFEVSGETWKDHEYSTSVLEEGAVGWDWFSLSFDNAADNALMYFQIRQADGSLQPFSSGSWIAADSSVEKITLDDVDIEVLDTWTSPITGTEYPVAWRLSIPRLNLELEGEAMMPNQELNVFTTYWEGAVAFTGTLDGEPVNARGYVELTGYEEAGSGRQ